MINTRESINRQEHHEKSRREVISLMQHEHEEGLTRVQRELEMERKGREHEVSVRDCLLISLLAY